MTGYRSLKERQRQEREALILRVAEEQLLEKGYAETSPDEIAAQVGISKGTLYLHFASKEDLLLAVFEQQLLTIHENMRTLFAQTTPPQERLQAFIQQVGEQRAKAQQAKLLYILQTTPELRIRLREVHKNLLQAIRSLLVDLIVEGQASEVFDPSLPVDVIINAFFIFLAPYKPVTENREPTLSQEDFLRGAQRLFFRGIGLPPT